MSGNQFPSWRITITCMGLLAGLVAGEPKPESAPSQPAPALNLPCRVVDVHDGDTCTVEIKITAKVRLLDCWAPELKQLGGEESRDHLQGIAEGKDGLLSIPLGGKRHVGQVFSFDRALGDVWVDGVNVGAAQVKSGHATREITDP